MPPKREREQVRLLLELPHAFPAQALRRLLKYALRSCDIKCTKVEWLDAPVDLASRRGEDVEGGDQTPG